MGTTSSKTNDAPIFYFGNKGQRSQSCKCQYLPSEHPDPLPAPPCLLLEAELQQLLSWCEGQSCLRHLAPREETLQAPSLQGEPAIHLLRVIASPWPPKQDQNGFGQVADLDANSHDTIPPSRHPKHSPHLAPSVDLFKIRHVCRQAIDLCLRLRGQGVGQAVAREVAKPCPVIRCTLCPDGMRDAICSQDDVGDAARSIGVVGLGFEILPATTNFAHARFLERELTSMKIGTQLNC